jgi:hypothetical protein
MINRGIIISAGPMTRQNTEMVPLSAGWRASLAEPCPWVERLRRAGHVGAQRPARHRQLEAR